MIAVIIPGATGGFLLLFWLWALFDVISTDSLLVRNLPKGTWLFVVLGLSIIGAMAWLALGRPEGAGLSLGGQRRLPYEYNPERTAGSRVVGMEDSDGWSGGSARSLPTSMQADDPLAIRERKLMEKEAELAKREAELNQAAGDEGTNSDGGPDVDNDEEHG